MTTATAEATRNTTAPTSTSPAYQARTTANRRRGTRAAIAERPALSDNDAIALQKKGCVAAERFLARRGYDILERGWSCFAGTADLIALDDDVLVFVNVVTASGNEGSFPSEEASEEHREQWEKIALAFLGEYDLCDRAVRFDVVAIVTLGTDRALIRHHVNAFSVA